MFRGCIIHQACSQQTQQMRPGSISLVEHRYRAQLQKPQASQRTPGPRPKQRRNASERPKYMVEPLQSSTSRRSGKTRTVFHMSWKKLPQAKGCFKETHNRYVDFDARLAEGDCAQSPCTCSQGNATAASTPLPFLLISSRRRQALLLLALGLESQMGYVSCVYISICFYLQAEWPGCLTQGPTARVRAGTSPAAVPGGEGGGGADHCSRPPHPPPPPLSGNACLVC